MTTKNSRIFLRKKTAPVLLRVALFVSLFDSEKICPLSRQGFFFDAVLFKSRQRLSFTSSASVVASPTLGLS